MRRLAKAPSAGSISSAGNRQGIAGALAAAAVLVCLVIGVSGANAFLVSDGEFGSTGTADGRFVSPAGVATNEVSGDVYVADSGNSRIQRFDADGNFISKFGEPGSGPGQFSQPRAVAIDQADGAVYVADMWNDRIQKFSADGAFVKQFGVAGSGNGEFNDPSGVAVDPTTGDVLVADTGNNRIQRFDSSGAYLAQFGEAGSEDGQISGPSRIAVDSTGAIYVLASERVQKFGPTGTFIVSVVSNQQYLYSVEVDGANDHLFVLGLTADEKRSQVIELDEDGNSIETYIAGVGYPTDLAYNTANRTAYVTVGNRVVIMVTPPPIFNQAAAPTYTEARLSARISAEGEATTYRFEYGQTASYGSSTAPRTAAASQTPLRVTAQLLNLPEGTTFHYRIVAVNGKGELRGPDATFTTLTRSAGSGSCPNADIREAQGADHTRSCRAYEMVSPPEKNGSDVYIYAVQSAVDGNSVAYQSAGAFSGAQGAAHGDEYIARRGPAGWVTEAITPPQTPVSTAPYVAPHGFEAFTSDLSRSVMLNYSRHAGGNQHMLYLRDEAGELSPITPPAANPSPWVVPRYVASSADMSRIFFESGMHLTADAPAEGVNELYEWSDGTVRVVGVLPSGEIAPDGASLGRGPATLSGRSKVSRQNAISGDGKQVVFASGSPTQVYLRTDGAETKLISASEKAGSVGDPAPAGATFVGSATEDGNELSKIYFVSTSELTDESFTGPEETGIALYEYDLDSGDLQDVVVSTDPANPIGANVEGEFGGTPGYIGAANDGEYVYFTAAGQLADGAPSPSNSSIYVKHNGTVKYVGKKASFEFPIVSENGEKLLFVSPEQQTEHETDGFDSAYLYDAPSDTLTCISCPDGRSPTGDASTEAFLTGYTYPLRHQTPRVMSADGKRIYFNSADPLDPRDSNGQSDVYEWREGEGVSLVSSGRGAEGALFLDASPSGDDVFIITRERLLESDRDSNLDVYDARRNGGLPLPPLAPTACEGDACQAPPNPPNDATPASAGFRGAGNPVAKSKRKASKRKQAQKKRKQQQRKHKRSGRKGAAAKHPNRAHR